MPVALTVALGGFIAGRAGLAQLTDAFVRRASGVPVRPLFGCIVSLDWLAHVSRLPGLAV